MANFTEQAIIATFIEMLNERPLNKITVSDISDACGISRNTFYYHFHDVYELVDMLFKSEEERLLSDVEDITTFKESMMAATRFALENRRAIYHIYSSVNRDVVSGYLFKAANICLDRYMRTQCEGLNVSERDYQNVLFLYTSMIQGAVMNYLREGAKEDPEPFIENVTRLLEGTIRHALENADRH